MAVAMTVEATEVADFDSRHSTGFFPEQQVARLEVVVVEALFLETGDDGNEL